jgi:hypothetical protein
MDKEFKLIGLNNLMVKPTKTNILNTLGLGRDELSYSDLLSEIFKMDIGMNILFDILKTKNIIIPDKINLEKPKVYREYHRLDITIIFDNSKFVIGIENKIDATERENQINDYQNIFEKYYKNFNGVFLFLTPDGLLPSSNSISSKYTCYSFSYKELLNSFSKINVSNDTFITHFVDCVKENIAMDDRDIDIINNIWGNFENRNKLNILLKNKPTIIAIKDRLSDRIKKYLNKNDDDISDIQQYSNTEIWISVNSLNKGNIPITFLFYDAEHRENAPCLRIVIMDADNTIPKKRIKKLKDKFDDLSFEKLPKWGGWCSLYTGKSQDADFIVTEDHDYGNNLVNILFREFKKEYEKLQKIVKEIS